MSDDIHFYEPRQGHGLPHDPFNAIVGPRPIGWISSLSAAGVPNLAPYSFFNAVNYKPPIIMFSSETRKDSLANIEATGEFCWNLVTRDLAEAMNASSAMVAPEIDEFTLAGLEMASSRVVKPPRVAASPVSFECKLISVTHLTSAAGVPTTNFLVLGEVVAVHIARRLLKDGVYDTANAAHVLRGGGPADYFEVRPETLFRMRRPKA